MRNSLFKRVVPLWNVLPDKMKCGNQTYDTLKKRLEKYFTEKVKSIDRNIAGNVGVSIGLNNNLNN